MASRSPPSSRRSTPIRGGLRILKITSLNRWPAMIMGTRKKRNRVSVRSWKHWAIYSPESPELGDSSCQHGCVECRMVGGTNMYDEPCCKGTGIQRPYHRDADSSFL